ncbi:MAG: YbaB/EbfC family nucleoid-associated protein [Bauldia sp.]|nr:YbaB/EbfC family nucleoid-associated protein [Bauldia sp.]
MRDILGVMKQAKELQGKMQQLQEELAQIEVEGVSGGGLVRVTLTAKNDMKRIAIDPSLLKPEEAEILEDLIVSAYADAKRKAEAKSEEKMRSLTGGLGLPGGMKLPF